MIPKGSNLIYGMTLRYPTNDMVGFGVERSRSKSRLGLGLTAIAYGVGSNSEFLSTSFLTLTCKQGLPGAAQAYPHTRRPTIG